MDIAIKIIQFFMSLSLLVAIHEFGHYIVARILSISKENAGLFHIVKHRKKGYIN